MSTIAFDPRVPDLRGPEDVISWVATGEPAGPMPEAWAMEAAGAARDGALVPELERVRDLGCAGTRGTGGVHARGTGQCTMVRTPVRSTTCSSIGAPQSGQTPPCCGATAGASFFNPS